MKGNTGCVLDDRSEDGLNSEMSVYEDDGFVVSDDHVDHCSDCCSESTTNNDSIELDVCYLCGEGGDLIVCDGGRNMIGCGRSAHLACTGRSSIPPGDWICEDCSNKSPLKKKVGKEGHEFCLNKEDRDNDDGKTETSPQKTKMNNDPNGDEEHAKNDGGERQTKLNDNEMKKTEGNDGAAKVTITKKSRVFLEDDEKICGITGVPAAVKTRKRRIVLEDSDDEN